MSDNTIVTIVWGVVFLFAIHGSAIYLTVRLLMTGRGLFERREHETTSRVVGNFQR